MKVMPTREEKDTLNRDNFRRAKDNATRGGRQKATFEAEEKIKQKQGLDPMVDPSGPPHLGPIRRSLPRFVKQGDLWLLTNGIPMAEETLLDTTGSMQDNVDLAFAALLHGYEMLTAGSDPIFRRYDLQVATAIFNDIYDNIKDGKAVLARSQFEMAEKIAVQMTLLPPGRDGKGNGKEDPQFGLFGAAYLTSASINRYGLKYYHYTVSDEPVCETIDLMWLKNIFGKDVLERVRENGYDIDEKNIPDVAKVIMDLQKNAHAFFFQVDSRQDVTRQWTELYGADHVIMLPDGTEYLHGVKAVVAGLTEGVLDLSSAENFMYEHKIPKQAAKKIVRAVAHIPLGAQRLCPNFDKIPKAGDLFCEKTDLWPVNPSEVATETSKGDDEVAGGAIWL
jgi:hypothetical protein